MVEAALIVAGLVFAVVAVLHFIRYFKALHIVIGNFTVPLGWSIYGGIVAALLAVWMLVAAGR